MYYRKENVANGVVCMTRAFEVLELNELRKASGRISGALAVDCRAERRAFRVRVALVLGAPRLSVVRAEAAWGDDQRERVLTDQDDSARRAVERFVEGLGTAALLDAAMRCCDGCGGEAELEELEPALRLCGACAEAYEAEDHPAHCDCDACRKERAAYAQQRAEESFVFAREAQRGRLAWVGLGDLLEED